MFSSSSSSNMTISDSSSYSPLPSSLESSPDLKDFAPLFDLGDSSTSGDDCLFASSSTSSKAAKSSLLDDGAGDCAPAKLISLPIPGLPFKLSRPVANCSDRIFLAYPRPNTNVTHASLLLPTYSQPQLCHQIHPLLEIVFILANKFLKDHKINILYIISAYTLYHILAASLVA
jgi:hypothetical protein